MKKFLVLLLALVLLASCGGSKSSGSTGGDGGDDVIKVALLIGYRGDMSFNDSAARGVDKAGAEIPGVEVKVIEYGTDDSKIEPTLLDTADEGYDMIIIGSSGLDYIHHAADYPDTVFVVFDAEADFSDGQNSNVYSIQYKVNEASYLAGYMAAKMSDTGVIGFLGGQDVPVISDFLVGYITGAQLANPDIKVAWAYTGSWNDSAKGKDQSLMMFNQKNASIVFGVAGAAGNGAIEAGAEVGKYVIGVDSDQHELFLNNGNETLANVITTSVLKYVDNSLYRAIELYVEGKLPTGTNEVLGIAEGGAGLAKNSYYEETVPAELRAEIDELEAKITAGEITIISAYGLTTDEIDVIRNAVNP
ncbi:MAG: BMP family ABC transporter substrate-binding protein [Erysipelotrichaceae bacterium]|jgi:basic membrane protein A|nr:BMP family ABC transporter substrate-binding protein [Erysipelotrichaceae bacterium]